MFYPDVPNVLRKAITGYLNQANPPALSQIRAVIAPHAGYVYSGPVAAFAYKALLNRATPPKRIYVMGPSHRVWFAGVALADYAAFDTPLGAHPLDGEKIHTLIDAGAPFSAFNVAHAQEHSLEVQFPFLYVTFPDVPVVPLLFGDVDPLIVGGKLNQFLEPDDVIIVSSDLSHFHDNRTAHTLDHQFLDAVLSGNQREAARGEACGQAPALALMLLADEYSWRPHLLDYRTSGDVTGDTRRVVGYASVGYEETAQ
jgi:hypothetical protein